MQANQPNTLPATGAELRSLVSTFLNPLPSWISPSNAPRLGAPPPPPLESMGGGGGPPLGGGGGPGGGGADPVGIGGGGGIPGGGEATEGLPSRGVLLSIEDSGRGGAIVLKRSEAKCLAPP